MELAKGKEMVKYKNEIFFGEIFFSKKEKDTNRVLQPHRWRWALKLQADGVLLKKLYHGLTRCTQPLASVVKMTTF